MKKEVNIEALKEKARIFRKEILEVVAEAGSGHPGGSLSAVEIFVSLYFYKMRYRPQEPDWPDRDRFVMSKGHACPIAYVTLADAGFFPKEELATFRKLNSRLQGHIYRGVPGVEASTGSLGHGLSVANGMALGARLLHKDFKVYCLLGDGEIQEGSVWEAAMTAGVHNLDNLCAIVDYNKVQQNDLVRDIKNEEPVVDKWASFGWHVIDVDGHDIARLITALDEFDTITDKPTVIIAQTIKGKGVSFMEYNPSWHGKAPNKDELAKALVELGF